jgi:transcriptional regulator with XRE-family HTH domain
MSDVIGARIRDLRGRKGVSLGVLAPKVGLTKQALSKIERGEFAPSAETLRALAVELDVPVGAFFDDPATDPVMRLREQGQHLLAVMGEDDLIRAVAVLEALVHARRVKAAQRIRSTRRLKSSTG